ncbi:MAG: dockerin type I domain-containing protein, partial [Planctomycetota bacterium]
QCPQPEGACCFIDGTCSSLTATDCAAASGTYQGDFTDCASANCPQPIGGCCFPDGTCEVLTNEDCIAQGGAFQGDFTLCGKAQCPQPDGACCLADGTCATTTADGCDASGGTYQGDFTDCGAANCPQPIGGCCFPDGSCAEVVAEDCAASGGKFQGIDVPCGPNECAQPAGGCCFADGNCQLLTGDDCANAGGVYQGDESDCQPGTCPQPGPVNDLCEDAIEISSGLTPYTTINANTDGEQHDECEYDGQTYQDVWYAYVAECDGELTVSTCEDLGGSADYDTDLVLYLGDPQNGDCGTLALLACNDDDADNGCGDSPGFQSTIVFPVVGGEVYTIRVGGWNPGDEGSGELLVACAPAIGACCFGDGTCEVLTGNACTLAGGLYQGDATLCGDAECPQPPDCPSDVNGDGVVDVQDLVEVILAWGSGQVDADVNNDGMVDVQDLVMVIVDWGACE